VVVSNRYIDHVPLTRCPFLDRGLKCKKTSAKFRGYDPVSSITLGACLPGEGWPYGGYSCWRRGKWILGCIAKKTGKNITENFGHLRVGEGSAPRAVFKTHAVRLPCGLVGFFFCWTVRKRPANWQTVEKRRQGDLVSGGAGTNLTVGVRGEGGTHPAQSAGKTFLSCPFTCWALKVQLVVLVSALSWWSVQFGQFLLCCSSTHGAPVSSHL